MARTYNEEINGPRNIIYAIRLTYDLTHEYRYVGLSSRGTKRFNEHLGHAYNENYEDYNSHKSRWIRKNSGKISFDILETVSSTDDLALAEIKWMTILKERGHKLMNETQGGDGTFGYRHTEEAKNAMSMKKKGLVSSFKGKTHSEESKRKQSEAKSGPLGPMYGRSHSAETKKKMSESQKGVNGNNYGKSATPETRAKMSKSRLGNTNGLRGSHTRWHTGRGISNPSCSFCSGISVT